MCVAQVTFYWQSKVHEHSLVECRECSNSYCCVTTTTTTATTTNTNTIIIVIIIYSECYILFQVM
jgi:hypothetical protein